MNTLLLKKIRDQIKAEPRQFNIHDWFSGKLPNGSTPANCGTAACIAGWSLALATGQNPAKADKMPVGVYRFGKIVLGLNDDQAKRLFFEGLWPKRYQSSKRTIIEERARLAVNRINHFIKTEGRE